MLLPEFSVIRILLAALPLLLVVYVMVGRNWDGSRAGLIGWLMAAIVAMSFFGAGPLLLIVSFGRGLLLALYVLYIIWMALLLYHTVNEAGVIGVIGEELPGLAPDRAGQALLLAWVFGSFLQGASGFGVPAAVVAPLLVGLGFPPNTAVALALLGHGWAVSFGSLGASFLALMAASGLPGNALAVPSGLLLVVACFGCGLGVVLVSGGICALRQRWRLLLMLTAIMGGVQLFLAFARLWNLAAFGAGIVGLFAGIALLRPSSQRANPSSKPNFWRLGNAFLPYGMLVAVIILGQSVFADSLDGIKISINFPAVETQFGWETPAGSGQVISLFGHAGALLLYTSMLAYLWFRIRGTMQAKTDYQARTLINKTVRGSIKSTVSIVALVAMAMTMQHAGMTQLLAQALTNTGSLFPFLSPFIGALGAFVTGSNTNSNVIFTSLQQYTGQALGLSVPFVLAGQNSGGAIGGVFAPAKVVVGVSTVSGAEDGVVMRLAASYGLGILIALGLVAWLLA